MDREIRSNAAFRAPLIAVHAAAVGKRKTEKT